ncbi:MAG: restriction endonuclease [Halobacterium sp.]
MPDSEYVDQVAEYLQGDGWTTSRTRVREDAVVVSAVRDADPGSLLAMVVDDPDGDVTPKYVKYLVKTAKDKQAGAALVTTTGTLTDEAAAFADEYGVDTVAPDAVRSALGGGFDVDPDQVSMPDGPDGPGDAAANDPDPDLVPDSDQSEDADATVDASESAAQETPATAPDETTDASEDDWLDGEEIPAADDREAGGQRAESATAETEGSAEADHGTDADAGPETGKASPPDSDNEPAADEPVESGTSWQGAGDDLPGERGDRSLVDRWTSRARPVLVAAVVVLLAAGVVASTGAGGPLGDALRSVPVVGGGGDASDQPAAARASVDVAVSEVPRKADFVLAVDGTAFTNDALATVTRTGLDRAPESATGFSTLPEALGRAEALTGVDPRSVESVTVYAAANAASNTYVAAHVTPDGSTPARSALERATNRNGRTVTYHGTTVFALPASAGPTIWYAELPDGSYLYGTKPAVKDGIDVARGDAPTLSASFQSELENARNAPVTFGYVSGETIASGPFAGAESVVGTVTAGNGRVSLSATIDTSSEDTAEGVATRIRSRIDTAVSQLGSSKAVNVLRDASVTTDGSRVTLAAGGTPASIGQLLQVAIDVSGVFQSKAANTSPESTAEPGYVQFVNVYGNVEDGRVVSVKATVKPSSGSTPIDLSKASVRWLGDSRQSLGWAETAGE